MSLWRKELLKRIRQAGHNPDAKAFQEIRGASDVMEAFMYLKFFLMNLDCDDPASRPIAGAVFDFARWCVSRAPQGADAGGDPFTAAIIVFYEDLPLRPELRHWTAEFMSCDEFDRFKEAFLYHLNLEQLQQFCQEFSEARAKTARIAFKRSKNSGKKE